MSSGLLRFDVSSRTTVLMFRVHENRLRSHAQRITRGDKIFQNDIDHVLVKDLHV